MRKLVLAFMLVASFAVVPSGAVGSAVLYTGGAGPSAVTTGDVNGDGRADIVVSNGSSGRITVQLASGTGQFQAAPASYPTGARAWETMLSDVNNDGRLDAVVATGVTGGSYRATVLLGTGTGAFGPPANYGGFFTAGSTIDLAVGDVNGDGTQDVALVTGASSLMQVLFGLGNGAFTLGSTTSLPFNAADVALADLNGDGRLDAVTSNGAVATTVSVLNGIGNGAFQPANQYQAANWPTGLAIGDLNNDGRPDVVVGNGVQAGLFRASVLINNGATLAPPVTYPVGSGIFGGAKVAVGYLDNDATLDVAVVNASLHKLNVLPGNGGGALGAVVSTATGVTFNTCGVAVGSFTGGSFDGAAVCNIQTDASSENTLSVFLPVVPPSVPLTVTAVAGPNIGEVTVSWSPPASNGGSAITAYTLCKGSTSGSHPFCTTLGGNATSFTDTGMLPVLSTGYYVVSASNVAGQGPRSAEVCSKPYPWAAALGC